MVFGALLQTFHNMNDYSPSKEDSPSSSALSILYTWLAHSFYHDLYPTVVCNPYLDLL